jgi:hypothetical protein
MTAKLKEDRLGRHHRTNALKNWIMVALTITFILLYGAALLGSLKPLADQSMVSRLEPIIFVIIGYYFGRLPSQQNEDSLKDEINRQTQRADAAQHVKEQTQQAREALEEKMKNVRTALASASPGITVKGQAESGDRVNGSLQEEAVRQAMTVALNILNS